MADFQGRGQYDLILCQSVIQYLGDKEAETALANIARLCREAAWYRKVMGRYFRSAGGGLFLPKDSHAVLYELEGENSKR